MGAHLPAAQTIAVVYFGLTCFTQLVIFLSRNPSFWWRFGPRSAPRPSWALVLPVLAFVTAAFFIGAEWPRSVQVGYGVEGRPGAVHPRLADCPVLSPTRPSLTAARRSWLARGTRPPLSRCSSASSSSR